MRTIRNNESRKKYIKSETLIKLHLGQTPTVPFVTGNEMEENPLRLPTLIRAALEISRQEMQAIQVIGRL